MQQSLTSRETVGHNIVDFSELNINYQAGSAKMLHKMQIITALEPFSDQTIQFLTTVSKILFANPEVKAYPDVVTLAFWMRRSSTEALKKRFVSNDGNELYRLGRGVAFHIAPSNVPVNYAYSLVTGLLCGNANVVRIPSKDFPQVRMINMAIQKALQENENMAPYIVLVQYGHDTAINDAFSAIADVRVIWGGDRTIHELRKSAMKPRATEITFADRYSLAVIDSDIYMEIENKAKTANDFYNDTYLTDQNACTSPRVVAWMGSRIEEAKKIFWRELYELVEQKYEIQGVQAVHKLASSYLLAVDQNGVKKEQAEDNLIVRMKVNEVSAGLMELKDNSGYFLEYDCKDVLELKELCNDTGCQTIAYIGDKKMLLPLVMSGVKGIDRVVPVGESMAFDLMWDGYNLFERMTRSVIFA